MFKYIKKDPADLMIPLVPFIFFGSSARALVDNNIYPLTYLLVTPGIYVLTGLSNYNSFGSSFSRKKTNFDYRYTIVVVGAVICIPNIILMGPVNMIAALQVVGGWAIISSIFIILRNKWTFT